MLKKIFLLSFFSVFCIFLFFSTAKQLYAYMNNLSASLVIFQADFIHNGSGGVNAQIVNSPGGVATDGTHIAISDTNNNRVLLFNSVPKTNNPVPDVIIGQQNFTSSSPNQGGAVAANTLNVPEEVFFTDNKLFIADTGNNRVLIFNAIPAANNASADVVIGQPVMSTTAIGTTSATLNTPWSIGSDNGKLAISDAGNNRVLLYNKIPNANGTPADIVLGQSNFTSNNSSTTANTLSFPEGVQMYANHMFVSDTGNNRVLIWNSLPTQNQVNADVVVGQPDFVSSSANQGGSANANTLNGPTDVGFDGARFFVSDAQNNRILLFNGIPATNNLQAYQVIGQSNFSNTSVNQGGAVDANMLDYPSGGFAMFGKRFMVADSGNNRVLFYYNVVRYPKLTFENNLLGLPNGKLRLKGTATLLNNYQNYTIQSMQFQVNGSGWAGVTPADGDFNDPTENYYIDFDPKSNNNNADGYTIKARAVDTNLDVAEGMLYFQPFTINSPPNNFTTKNPYPIFEFSVNTQKLVQQTLSRYQIWTRRPGVADWKLYLSVPPDFVPIKTTMDNLQRNNYYFYAGNDGIFETTRLKVTYSQNGSHIQVRAKDLPGFSTKKMFGSYYWKVVAVDKTGNGEESESRFLRVDSRRRIPTNGYFPLMLVSMGGLNNLNLSTNQPTKIKSSYTIQTTTPSFYGITPRNAQVTLTIPGMTSFTTTANTDSRFGINIPKGILSQKKIYTVILSEVLENNYNELPSFRLTFSKAGTMKKMSNKTTTKKKRKRKRSAIKPYMPFLLKNIVPSPKNPPRGKVCTLLKSCMYPLSF